MINARWLVLGVPVIGAIAIAAYGLSLMGSPSRSVLDAGKPGRALYEARCSICHGVELQGQPNWMTRLSTGRLPAPPHDETGHTWHHSDQQLFTIVKFGLGAIAPGYETDMPAFEGTLSDTEIQSILDYIKSTWSDRAKAFQAKRTEAEK